MNSILVVASSRVLMDRAVNWICELDSKSDALANVHVYHVENYKARNLADILRQSYGEAPSGLGIKETKTRQPDGVQIPGRYVNHRRGRRHYGRLSDDWDHYGRHSGSRHHYGRQTWFFGRGNGIRRAAPWQPAKNRPYHLWCGGKEAAKENIRIIPDEENNLLVVIAPPYEWQTIQNLLRRLDIMPRQVLSEVLPLPKFP